MIKVTIPKSEVQKVVKAYRMKLRKIEREIERETAYAAYEIEARARLAVPVDTDNLRTSIQADKLPGIGLTVWRVATNVQYAHYIEFGEPIGTGPNGGPKPYMRPAFNAVRPAYIQKVRAILRR